jgi:transposase-like protein
MLTEIQQNSDAASNIGAATVAFVPVAERNGLWRREFKEQPTKAFSGHGRRVLAESREAELEREIGQLTMENDFLKKLLRSFEEQQVAVNGGGPSTKRSGRKKSP